MVSYNLDATQLSDTRSFLDNCCTVNSLEQSSLSQAFQKTMTGSRWFWDYTIYLFTASGVYQAFYCVFALISSAALIGSLYASVKSQAHANTYSKNILIITIMAGINIPISIVPTSILPIMGGYIAVAVITPITFLFIGYIIFYPGVGTGSVRASGFRILCIRISGDTRRHVFTYYFVGGIVMTFYAIILFAIPMAVSQGYADATIQQASRNELFVSSVRAMFGWWDILCFFAAICAVGEFIVSFITLCLPITRQNGTDNTFVRKYVTSPSNRIYSYEVSHEDLEGLYDQSDAR